MSSRRRFALSTAIFNALAQQTSAIHDRRPFEGGGEAMVDGSCHSQKVRGFHGSVHRPANTPAQWGTCSNISMLLRASPISTRRLVFLGTHHVPNGSSGTRASQTGATDPLSIEQTKKYIDQLGQRRKPRYGNWSAAFELRIETHLVEQCG